jgi:hypothetical protein
LKLTYKLIWNLWKFFHFISFQQGYFRTSKGSFFIEPIQDYVDENKNILHLLYRRPHIPKDKEDAEECDLSNSSHGEFLLFIWNVYTTINFTLAYARPHVRK